MTGKSLRKYVDTFSLAAVANNIPALKRGMVWCITCKRKQAVDAAECLRHGWPKCCGYTMTIDSPQQRAAWAKKAERQEPSR